MYALALTRPFYEPSYTGSDEKPPITYLMKKRFDEKPL
jgi:hypothetical protein